MPSKFVVLHMGSEVFATKYEVADMTHSSGIGWRFLAVSTGGPAFCENYHLISQVGYIFFASILLNGMNEAGAANTIWPRQFSFRVGHVPFFAKQC